jgi:hypothetical protein
MKRPLLILALTLATLVLTACAGNNDDDANSEDAPPTGTPETQTVYRGLSLSEAQEIVSFDLLIPERVPDDLVLAGVDVFLVSDSSPYESAYLVYQPADGEPLVDRVVFQQSDMIATVTQDESEEVEISGRTITTFHTAHDADGNPLAMYSWNEDGIAYILSGRLQGDIEEAYLVEPIEALP